MRTFALVWYVGYSTTHQHPMNAEGTVDSREMLSMHLVRQLVSGPSGNVWCNVKHHHHQQAQQLHIPISYIASSSIWKRTTIIELMMAF